MTLQTIHLWEIIFDVAQICLAGLIILFLILNRIQFKQLILRAPTGAQPRSANTDFAMEAVRQQTELAFDHIVETIEKERQTLDTCYHQRDKRLAPEIFTPVSPTSPDPQAGSESSESDPGGEIYGEIERLADQGLSTSNISERLNVPQGEVDLVLKLKHLRIGAANKKAYPPA